MTDRSVGTPVWYRSLYWRIGLGLVGLLAGLLLLQALVFLWMSGTIATNIVGQSPEALAANAAAEVAAALQKNPKLDIDAYVREHYGRLYQPLMVVMDDGRVARNHELPGFQRGDRPPFDRRPGRAGAPGSGPAGTRPERPVPGGAPAEPPPTGPSGAGPDLRGAEQGGPRRAGPPPEGSRPPRSRPMPPMPGGPGGPGGQRASIEVGGARVGFVAVAGRGPRTEFLLRQFGPTLGIIFAVLLVLGAAVGSLAIFAPARRRLRALEQVARALGAGDASVRAAESGGDEVTALARAFNKMADDLEARTSAVEASDRTRRQLLADVSHELKTPLASIRGYVETLAMPEVQLDEGTRRRYLDIVSEETIKLERIVGDLLDLARLESRGMMLTCGPVSAAELFRSVTDRNERELIERQVNLDTVIEPGAEEVWGDPTRLEQALQNLVANALRHTPDGGQITVVAAGSDAQAKLIVRDNGPGIPEEHLPRIFDRFYKVDASRSDPYSQAGSGLGLSIVKAIVERHGGTVAAANLAAGGAEFVISLPARAS